MPVQCTCRTCGQAFGAKASRVAAGGAIYCSRPCRDAAYGGRGSGTRRTEYVTGACAQCGVALEWQPSQPRVFCSRTCHALAKRRQTGPLAPRWKGQPYITKHGYVHVSIPGQRRRYEHQLVWEAANGPIPAGHHVHHVNGVKTDNRLENLELLTAREHRRLHNHKRWHG